MLRLLPIAAIALLLSACTILDPLTSHAPAGNPQNDAYAGAPGSVYDVAGNPPRFLGTVSYDPDKAQPLPAGEDIPAAPPAGPMTAPPPAPARR